MPDPIDRIDCRTVFRYLKTYSEWNDHNWKTMELTPTDDTVLVELDKEPVHFLEQDELLPHVPRHNAFDFDEEYRLLPSTSLVYLDGKPFIMKIAAFPSLLPYLWSEVWIYNELGKRNLSIIPKLIAYIYEEHPERVIGTLCEFIEGHPPGPDDRAECIKSLQRLHKEGLYHGDIKYQNIIMRPSGEAVLIDFDTSDFAQTEEQFAILAPEMQQEMSILETCPLKDITDTAKQYMFRIETPRVPSVGAPVIQR